MSLCGTEQSEVSQYQNSERCQVWEEQDRRKAYEVSSVLGSNLSRKRPYPSYSPRKGRERRWARQQTQPTPLCWWRMTTASHHKNKKGKKKGGLWRRWWEMSCSVKQRVIMKTVYDPHIPCSFKTDVMHSTGGVRGHDIMHMFQTQQVCDVKGFSLVKLSINQPVYYILWLEASF